MNLHSRLLRIACYYDDMNVSQHSTQNSVKSSDWNPDRMKDANVIEPGKSDSHQGSENESKKTGIRAALTNERNFEVRITSGTIVRGILIVLLLIFLYYIKDILLVILTAVVIASSVEPATKWFDKFRIRRLPAVVIMYVGVGLILAAFFVFFLPSLLDEALVYIDSLPQNFSLSDLWSPIHDSGILADKTISIQGIVDTAKEVISGTGEGAIKVASSVFGGVLSFILIIVLSFYLSVQEDGVGDFLRIISPSKHRAYIIDLWKRSQIKIGYWMQGQLLLGLIVGIFVYLGLLIFGVKHALLLASIAVIFELIPVFGPILSAIPAVIIAVVDGGATLGVLIAGYYLLIHQFENHLLYPLVVKKIVGISPILVIVALVIGAKLAGFLGILLSVPAAAVIMEFVNDIEKRRFAKQQ